MRPPFVPLLFAVGLAGCSVLRPHTDPTRFYVLAPLADVAPVPPTGLVLGLGPVVLPRYLQEPALARRVGPNEVRFADFARWAGPLQTQVASTLAEDLRVLLGTDRVVAFPWYPDTVLDVVVEVEVLRFEPDTDGQVHLAGRWKVADRAGAVLRGADADVREPVAAADPDTTVAALSRALGRLGREIADGVRATRPASGSRPRQGRVRT